MSLVIRYGFTIELQSNYLNTKNDTVSAAGPEIRSKCSFTQKDSTFSQFYPLSDIPGSQPDGFFAKVTVSVTSDYGDVHILLAESDDFENTNRGYEFGNFNIRPKTLDII